MFGIFILIAHYEFGSRSELWANTQKHKYLPAVSLGNTGMSRHRFDNLFKALRFSRQAEYRPEGMSHERHRWQLVDDFVHNFNDHRSKNFKPGTKICVDESISRWYGQGGDWINKGLPMYVAIDRKPEQGCEIQNASCAESGIMIQLKLVKTKDEEERDNVDDGINHGTKVLTDLVKPWANSNRIVCADSYFASKQTIDCLRKMGLRFIGVVKTATKGYPMGYLSKIELHKRGDHHGVVSFDGNSNSPNTLAFVWMDRKRRYFISLCSSLQKGKPWIRERWRQVNREDPNAEAEKVQLVVPQTKCGKLYYDTCASIDQHNRSRQQTLNLEKNCSVRHGTRESTYLSSPSVLLIHGRHIQMLHKQSQRNENSTYVSQRS